MAQNNPNEDSPLAGFGGSFLGGLATSALGGVLGYHANANLQRQQYKNEKALMQESYKLGQIAQENAPGNLVRGAKSAGLSPLAVLGQSFSPAQGPSGNAVGATVASPDVAGAMLAAAQTRLVNAEAAEKELTLQREHDADNSFVVTFKSSLEREKADIEQQLASNPQDKGLQKRLDDIDASLDRLENPEYRGTIGVLKGISAGADYNAKNFDVVNNYLLGRQKKDVLIRQLGNGTAAALANIPVQQQHKMAEDIAYVKQLIAESESKEELNDQQVLELQEKIRQIGNDMLHANLNDPNFIKAVYGENSQAWKNWTDTQWREESFRVGEKIIEGIATGSGLAIVNSAMRQLENSKKPQQKKPTEVREETTFSRGRRRSIRSVMYE